MKNNAAISTEYYSPEAPAETVSKALYSILSIDPAEDQEIRSRDQIGQPWIRTLPFYALQRG